MDRWIDGWIELICYIYIYYIIEWQMDGWMEGKRMDGWMDEWCTGTGSSAEKKMKQ